MPDAERAFQQAFQDLDSGKLVVPTYKILRFWRDFDRETEVIARGLTLEEAQAHCRRDDTHGEGWFDGYDEE